MRLRTTAQHKKFWENRKIDWSKEYLATWNHPHRQMIIWALQTFPWVSLWEVGCGPGANIVRIVKEFKNKQLGGSDINQEAVELARATFADERTNDDGTKVKVLGGRFNVEPIENLLLSDNSVDVVLSDAALIYYGPRQIDAAIKEMVRVARNHIVLCEFHGTNPWERMKLRFKTGYNAYNYRALLEKHGCHNIQLIKIPKEFWEGFPWETWGYIIIARVTKI